jgi:DNA-binding XRE family transcriptional regulator
MKKKATRDAVTILRNRFYRGKPERIVSLDEERVNARIARDIYSLRTGLGLTQKQLAKMVGTAPSAISRLENADYPGHSLSMLQKIAQVLNRKVEVKFVRIKAKPASITTLRERRVH